MEEDFYKKFEEVKGGRISFKRDEEKTPSPRFKKKTSKLAIASFICPIIGFLCYLVVVLFGAVELEFLRASIFYSGLLLMLFSPILGIISIISIIKNKERLNVEKLGLVTSILGLLIAIFIFYFAILIIRPRPRAKDPRIISAMRQIQIGAEIYHSVYDSYTGLDCDVTEPVEISNLCTDIKNQTGQEPTIEVSPNGSQFCAYTILATRARYYCVTVTRAVESSIDPSTTCNATISSFTCPPSD